ncbi:hypothetical protein FJ250_03030 [bacterium]|nr:hypothetical protein [bacterium]
MDLAVSATVTRELGRSRVGAAHIDDVVSDVRLRLVRKLWSLRQGDGEMVEDLEAYAATAAEYGCRTFLRQQYPARTRLRGQIRYALSHHPGTSLERDAHGTWRCGTTRSPRLAPAPGSAEAFVRDPAGWLEAHGLVASAPLPDLLDAVLARLDRGLDLDRFVDAMAAALGVADLRRVETRTANASPGAGLELVADSSPGIADVLEHREALARTWREIADLPPNQRVALLLNLRDPEGRAVLPLLPPTGVAAMADIAAAVGLSAAELEAMWPSLPCDDLAIAARLGLTRQQVINLRKSARARLARRLHW